jgi:hypothetical protein
VLGRFQPNASQEWPGLAGVSAHGKAQGGARSRHDHRVHDPCGGTAGGGPSVDGRRRGLRVEYRQRGAEASGKVREAGNHRVSGAMVGWWVSGRAVWWSPVGGGGPCSILESRGR